jgi:hypothetical protein
MDQVQAQMAYVCPMHPEVRQVQPGKCPKCGMALFPERTRFGLLRHMASRPLHIVIMVLLMVLVMAAAMLMWHS